MKPTLPCKHCSGKGRVALAGPLLACANALKRLGTATAQQVHDASPMGNVNGARRKNDVTATYRRLERLIDLGLALEIDGEGKKKFRVVGVR